MPSPPPPHTHTRPPSPADKQWPAPYVLKVDVFYPKGDKLLEMLEETQDDDNDESSFSDDNEDSHEDENVADGIHTTDLLYKAKNGIRYKKRKIPRIIRYVRYNKKQELENYCREQLLLFTPWRN